MKERVFISGGASMVGQKVCQKLHDRGYEVLAPSHQQLDLTGYEDLQVFFRLFQPEFIIHCAGFNGNIQFNKEFPAQIYSMNVLMNNNILEAAYEYSVKKTVSILPSCSYHPAMVLEEDRFNSGPPHESVECHGLAKRVLFDFSRQLYKQFKSNFICVVLNNCYGPRDSFAVEKTKVVGGLIQKFASAVQDKSDEVTLWGDGSPLRELMYVDDAAEGIIRAFERYDDPMEVLNIGGGTEISIDQLAELIKELTGFAGKITWDVAKGNGQMRKLLSREKSDKVLGNWERVGLAEGLRTTIEWYKSEQGV